MSADATLLATATFASVVPPAPTSIPFGRRAVATDALVAGDAIRPDAGDRLRRSGGVVGGGG